MYYMKVLHLILLPKNQSAGANLIPRRKITNNTDNVILDQQSKSNQVYWGQSFLYYSFLIYTQVDLYNGEKEGGGLFPVLSTLCHVGGEAHKMSTMAIMGAGKL